jgi:uncharacterized membrane protein YuzA (DUF378 family)
MWALIIIIGQLAAALIGAFVINLIWKLSHPGQGWFG